MRSVCQAALDGRLPIPVGISLQMQSIDFTEPEQVGVCGMSNQAEHDPDPFLFFLT